MLSVFTLLFAKNLIFAGNIGRTVYGVLTETYNGVSIDNPSAGQDYVTMPGSGYNSDDRIEGSVSTSIGSQYWFGIMFNTPQNMSAYTGGRLYFSAKVPANVDITNTGNSFKLKDVNERELYFNSESIKRIDDGSTILGTKISNDNEWHTYYIELSSFTDLDLTNITYLFIIGSPVNDNSILVDNVYWTKAPSATRAFTVTVKNRDDNQVTDNITWTTSDFRQSWTAAQQYIELDLDQESSNWTVSIYLNNSSATRNGLYCVDSYGNEKVLRMAWRISPSLIPNSDATLQISKDSRGLLYDSGKISQDPAWSYAWAYFYDKKDTSMVLNDTIVWDLKGCHTFVYDNEEWKSLANYYERKPKIYFAADCSNALGGLIYTATVVTELVYE